jgi:hypothetical protein
MFCTTTTTTTIAGHFQHMHARSQLTLSLLLSSSPPLLLSSSPPLLLSSSRPVQLSEAEWYAETYSVRSEPHFALLLFWVHTEVMRRAVSMAYRQALLRARRLQFKAYQSDIVNLLKATKMEDR